VAKPKTITTILAAGLPAVLLFSLALAFYHRQSIAQIASGYSTVSQTEDGKLSFSVLNAVAS